MRAPNLLLIAAILALGACASAPERADVSADPAVVNGYMIRIEGAMLACLGDYPERLVCVRTISPARLCSDSIEELRCSPPESEQWPVDGERI